MTKIYLMITLITSIVSMTIGKDMVKQIMEVAMSAISGIELQNIDRALVMNKIRTDVYPNEGDFQKFLYDNLSSGGGRDQAYDHWGTPYVYKKGNDGYTLTTAGPDKRLNTEDDISLIREGNRTRLTKDTQKALAATLDTLIDRQEKIITQTNKLSAYEKELTKEQALQDKWDDIMNKVKNVDVKEEAKKILPKIDTAQKGKTQSIETGVIKNFSCPVCNKMIVLKRPEGQGFTFSCPQCKSRLKVRNW